MDAATISAIAEVIEAIPDGPYITIGSPFPGLEQVAGRDINLGSTFGDINLPFGEDAIDVHTETTDDNSTTVSDVVDVNTGNGVIVDSAIEPAPEEPAGETIADSAIEPERPEAPEIETGETTPEEPAPTEPSGEPTATEPAADEVID